MGFPGDSDGKEPSCNAGELGLMPGFGRSSEGRHGNPLQYSCLKNTHRQRSLVGYSAWGHRVGHDWVNKHSTAAIRYTVKLNKSEFNLDGTKLKS